MSKFLKTLLSVMLALTLVFAFTGCDETGDDSGDTTTGEFVYQLATGTKTVDGDEVEYSYYKITGFTAKNEDIEKFEKGDFSSLGATADEISAKRNITIQPEYKGLPVEEIESMAFANKLMIQSVTFPADTNIKKIGAGAFAGCTNLEAINGLPFIGAAADSKNEERVLGHIFGAVAEGSANTTTTSKIVIEESEASASFIVPTSFKKLVLANSVTVIPECAFYGFTMIQEVVATNVTEIGAGAFTNCTSLISIKLPMVETIYDCAFDGCSVLQKVDLTGNTTLTWIGDSAFAGCVRLGYSWVEDSKDKIQLDLSTVTHLGEKAFNGCSTLKYVKLSGISELNLGTFAECVELKEVVLKDSSVKISACVFTGCEQSTLKVVDLEGKAITLTNEMFGEATFPEVQ